MAAKFDYDGLPARIAEAREAVKMSRAALGEKLGVSRQAVHRWELPPDKELHTMPEWRKLEEMALLLNTDLLWLITGRHYVESTKEDPGQLRPVRRLEEFHLSAEPQGYKRASFQSSDWSAWLIIADEDNSPEFLPGEYCLLEPKLLPGPGKMVLARLPEKEVNVFRQYTVTGLGAQGEPVITLRPLNPAAACFSSATDGIAVLATLSAHLRDMTRRIP